MNLDNFIIDKTKGEDRRGEIWQKKQQLLNKHSAAADGKRQLISISAANDMV